MKLEHCLFLMRFFPRDIMFRGDLAAEHCLRIASLVADMGQVMLSNITGQ